MKCPLCGSEITSGAKYCPVCGADVEAARRRAQAAVAPTQQMPRQASSVPQTSQAQAYGRASQTAVRQGQTRAGQQAQPQVARRGAVPMHPSMPATSSQPVRSIDTKGMSGMPKWPIVLIVLLVLVIIAAVVLFVIRPWESSTITQQTPSATTASTAADATTASGTGQATDATTTATDGSGTATPADATTDQAQADATTQTTSGTTDAAAYETLSAVYASLGDLGYGDESQIAQIAANFNLENVTEDRAVAVAVRDSITSLQSQLDSLTLAADSQYAETLATLKTLCDDLYQRIDVMVQTYDNSLNGVTGDELYEPLRRDNDSNGVNTYKTHFNENYPSAAPAAPAA